MNNTTSERSQKHLQYTFASFGMLIICLYFISSINLSNGNDSLNKLDFPIESVSVVLNAIWVCYFNIHNIVYFANIITKSVYDLNELVSLYNVELFQYPTKSVSA